MRLLLDTHVFLWWCSDSSRLSRDAVASISGADQVYVSAASAWECAIKSSIGKLRLARSVLSGILDSGFEHLPVTADHAAVVAGLDHHHKDPFDRMLVAQAICEGLTLVTADAAMARYGAPVLWAQKAP